MCEALCKQSSHIIALLQAKNIRLHLIAAAILLVSLSISSDLFDDYDRWFNACALLEIVIEMKPAETTLETECEAVRASNELLEDIRNVARLHLIRLLLLNSSKSGICARIVAHLIGNNSLMVKAFKVDGFFFPATTILLVAAVGHDEKLRIVVAGKLHGGTCKVFPMFRVSVSRRQFQYVTRCVTWTTTSPFLCAWTRCTHWLPTSVIF